ncbi:MAG: hypothetical protein IPM53_31385 [Anaerolineaceae bacterium]|nr:hypothetical protein [Anaerolineaceae bacterium]
MLKGFYLRKLFADYLKETRNEFRKRAELLQSERGAIIDVRERIQTVSGDVDSSLVSIKTRVQDREINPRTKNRLETCLQSVQKLRNDARRETNHNKCESFLLQAKSQLASEIGYLNSADSNSVNIRIDQSRNKRNIRFDDGGIYNEESNEGVQSGKDIVRILEEMLRPLVTS